MIIDGIEIPDEKLIEAGWTPPIPKPLQFDGTPVWAWVSNQKDGYENKEKRQVIAHGKYYIAMYSGGDITNSSSTFPWEYAWAIPEGEK